jgi:hypothetical protein
MLSNVVLKAITQHCLLDGAVYENTTMPIEGLSEEVARLRPDLSFVQRDDRGQTVEIIEFSCPYGQTSEGRNTLESTFEVKSRKYEQLAQEIRELTGKKVRVTAVIVSSMGAVYRESIRRLARVLGIRDERRMEKLARRMSEVVLAGSMEIWRRYVRHTVTEEVEMDRDVEALAEQEVVMSEVEADLVGEEVEGEDESIRTVIEEVVEGERERVVDEGGRELEDEFEDEIWEDTDEDDEADDEGVNVGEVILVQRATAEEADADETREAETAVDRGDAAEEAATD